MLRKKWRKIEIFWWNDQCAGTFAWRISISVDRKWETNGAASRKLKFEMESELSLKTTVCWKSGVSSERKGKWWNDEILCYFWSTSDFLNSVMAPKTSVLRLFNSKKEFWIHADIRMMYARPVSGIHSNINDSGWIQQHVRTARLSEVVISWQQSSKIEDKRTNMMLFFYMFKCKNDVEKEIEGGRTGQWSRWGTFHGQPVRNLGTLLRKSFILNFFYLVFEKYRSSLQLVRATGSQNISGVSALCTLSTEIYHSLQTRDLRSYGFVQFIKSDKASNLVIGPVASQW
jgi:hypothetical protein